MGRTPSGQTRKRVYRFVRNRLLAGQPPTVRDVQRAFGFRAVETARVHLEALVAEGRLRKMPGIARGYRLLERDVPVDVPLLGRVQAGKLMAAIEDPDGYIAVQSNASRDELFALRVRGQSMVGAGILSGDVVIVRRQPTAEHGEIVVAMVGDEATVKRLKIIRGRPELHAEHPDFPPIVPDVSDELRLLGKVVEVRRYLEESPP